MITQEQREEIIRKQARSEFLFRMMMIVIGAVVIAFMVTQLVAIKIGIDQRAAILSCTTPRGACYMDAQKRTARAVEAIANQNSNSAATTRQIIIYAAYCADQPENKDDKDIEECTTKLLKEEGDHYEVPGAR